MILHRELQFCFTHRSSALDFTAGFWHDHGPAVSDQAEIRKKQICEFGAGRPDLGGRWPRGETLGNKRRTREVESQRGRVVFFENLNAQVEFFCNCYHIIAGSEVLYLT